MYYGESSDICLAIHSFISSSPIRLTSNLISFSLSASQCGRNHPIRLYDIATSVFSCVGVIAFAFFNHSSTNPFGVIAIPDFGGKMDVRFHLIEMYLSKATLVDDFITVFICIVIHKFLFERDFDCMYYIRPLQLQCP